MDCGSASLRSLLEGCGVPVSYGRLREACQTDVDGTSINTMEEVAVQLGLDAEQILIPTDHVLLAESRALPAIVIVRRPSGEAHFVVVWRRHGRFVQVMDPAAGRKWMRCDQLCKELYRHVADVPASAWRKWAGSSEFIEPLRKRISVLGASRWASDGLVHDALADESWKSIAELDAAVRMVEAIVAAGGVKRGRRAGRVLQAIVQSASSDDDTSSGVIPGMYYWAVATAQDSESDLCLKVRGAVIALRASAKRRSHCRRQLVSRSVAEHWRQGIRSPPLLRKNGAPGQPEHRDGA